MQIEHGMAFSGSVIANVRSRQSAERRICALALVMCLGLLLTACGKKKVQAGMAPPEVVVADVLQQDVPEYGEWVAQLDGPVNAEITLALLRAIGAAEQRGQHGCSAGLGNDPQIRPQRLLGTANIIVADESDKRCSA